MAGAEYKVLDHVVRTVVRTHRKQSESLLCTGSKWLVEWHPSALPEGTAHAKHLEANIKDVAHSCSRHVTFDSWF